MRNRYPYTDAADYVRGMIAKDCGILLSRSDASYIRKLICENIDVDDVAVAVILANKYLDKSEGIE